VIQEIIVRECFLFTEFFFLMGNVGKEPSKILNVRKLVVKGIHCEKGMSI